MLSVQAIPAFNDNYIWLIKAANSRQAFIVDPGDAKPVIEAITQQQLIPTAILITHHHQDHIGGITSLLDQYDIAVYGPSSETVPHLTNPLSATNNLVIDPDFPAINILDIPGHTAGHIGYLIEDCLFCGDTLFAAGCGRLLGGTAHQLFHSLQQIAVLPETTKIYCTHEYTEANLHFALAVEPNNTDIQQRLTDTIALRKNGVITLPSTLTLELKTNPFLRCHLPEVRTAVEQQTQQQLSTSEAVFTALRKWKDRF